jgi:hypothetical protein
VQVQVLKNPAKENGYMIDFKRIDGDFFEFHSSYKKFYSAYYE